MRPEWRIETPANFIGTDWSGIRRTARSPVDRLGFSVAERHRDVATHRNFVRSPTNAMKAKTAGTQPERQSQIIGETRGALMEILGTKPEMLVENAFKATIDDRAHNLFDRTLTRQRRKDHRIVQIGAQSLPTELDQGTVACRVKDCRVMPQ